MKRIIKRYVWRLGIKGSMWAIRISLIFSAAAVANAVLQVSPNGWSLVAVIALYGIWEVCRTIRDRVPDVTVTKADILEVRSGAVVHLASADIDRLMTVIAKRAAERSEGVS